MRHQAASRERPDSCNQLLSLAITPTRSWSYLPQGQSPSVHTDATRLYMGRMSQPSATFVATSAAPQQSKWVQAPSRRVGFMHKPLIAIPLSPLFCIDIRALNSWAAARLVHQSGRTSIMSARSSSKTCLIRHTHPLVRVYFTHIIE